MTDTPEPDQSPEQSPEQERFRAFDGEETWDADALNRAYSQLRDRRSATGRPAEEGGSAHERPTLVPGQRPSGAPPPLVPAAPRSGSGRNPAAPVSNRGLFVAGVAAAVAAVLAAVIWLLVELLGGSGAAAGAAPPPSPALVIQTPAADQPTDPDTSDYDTSPASGQASSPLTDPAEVVYEYYDAINAADWQTAWSLGGENLSPSYQSFVAGYENTSEDDVTALDTGPTTASIELTATQTNGSTQQFSGTYTVVGGVITSADISQVG